MTMAQVYLYAARPGRSKGVSSDESNLDDTEPDSGQNGGGANTVWFGIGWGQIQPFGGSSNNLFGSGNNIGAGGSVFGSSNNIFGSGGNIGKGGKPGIVVVNNRKQT